MPRSRKRARHARPRPERAPHAPRESPTATAEPPAPRRRSEERNAAIRATLEPLAPGERPWPLLVAIVLAVLIGVSNIVQAIVGGNLHVGTARTSVAGALPFALIMLVCAWGMWRLRYWALLGFQALIAIIIILFAFVAVTANDIGRLVIAVVIMGALGTLFWKLVRVLSRLQMPKPS
jgi:hypothetical protein